MRSIAKRISTSLPSCFELDDLIGSGYLGLIAAASRYQPAAHNNTPFSAYARPVIHGAIVDSINRRAYVEATRPSASVVPDVLVTPDFDAELDRQAEARRLAAAVAKLPARHARVLKLHYGAAELIKTIGPRLGVGKSRASQLHMEAVRTLRGHLVAS